MTPTAKGIYDVLVNYGPIVYCGNWRGNKRDNGHVILITGIDTEGPRGQGPQLTFNDPLEAGPATRPLYWAFETLAQKHADQPLVVYDAYRSRRSQAA